MKNTPSQKTLEESSSGFWTSFLSKTFGNSSKKPTNAENIKIESLNPILPTASSPIEEEHHHKQSMNFKTPQLLQKKL